MRTTSPPAWQDLGGLTEALSPFVGLWAPCWPFPLSVVNFRPPHPDSRTEEDPEREACGEGVPSARRRGLPGRLQARGGGSGHGPPGEPDLWSFTGGQTGPQRRPSAHSTRYRLGPLHVPREPCLPSEGSFPPPVALTRALGASSPLDKAFGPPRASGQHCRHRPWAGGAGCGPRPPLPAWDWGTSWGQSRVLTPHPWGLRA